MISKLIRAPLRPAVLAFAAVIGTAAAAETSPKLAAVSADEQQGRTAAVELTGQGIGAFLAARQARMDGDTTAAARYYHAALSADPGNDWLARRSFVQDVSEGLIERALPMADRVRRNRERAPVANLVTSVDHMVNGRFGKAEALVKDVGKRGAMRLVGPLIRAWAAFGSGDLDRALARLKPLEARESFAPFRLYHQALLLGASGDAAGALAALDALPEGVSLDLRSRLVYAALLERRDGAEAATAYLKGLTARYGEDPVLRAYLNYGRPIAQAFPVAVARDGVAEALYGAASALSRESVSEAAMIYLRLALYARPDLDVARALLGDMMEDAERWDAAVEAFQGIDEASPYKWSARIRIAWAMDSLGRTDEAIALLRQMSGERETNLTTLATLADLLRGHRRFAEAADVYTEAVQRIDTPGPRHWSIYYARGIAFERSKQWDRAEGDLLKALELSPEQPLVMNYLGYSWVDQGIRLDEAVDMIQRAVDRRPSDGYVVDSLGWAYYRMGDYETAVKHLERATDLRPEDPIINDHLGDVYWKVGRYRESCFQWRHAISLEPDEEEIPKIRKKMREGLDDSYKGFRGCRF
jgi:tetratricopeptide (TPR) repeat protein